MTLRPDLNYVPDHIDTIHIMGICGTGMAALAGMLKQSGYTVTGSDSHIYPPMSDYLARIGIIPCDGYRLENIHHHPDLVIVGNVITSKNPEAIALGESAIPYLSFPQALAEFFIAAHTSIVVAGTHGKTTTCSLLASTLHHAGEDPGFMIGGIVSEFQSNNKIGEGDFFITEGDEYDTAFFDKGSKFLHYRPHVAIITSVEFDHADIFNNLEQIKDSFKKFVQLVPPDGLIIAHLDDANVAEVVANARCRVEGYGLQPGSDWLLLTPQTDGQGSTFTVTYKQRPWHTVQIPLSGTHNCLNTLAVIAALHNLGLTPITISNCLKKFKGVKRRQEVRGEENGITVIDDFAHHPTAVRETLMGLKKTYEGKRLVAVFEPRTNSSRRSVFQKQYVESFAAADAVIIREPVPPANVAPEDYFSALLLAEDLQARQGNALSFSSTDAILEHLDATSRTGDVIVILSNGSFDNIHERLLQKLHWRNPA